MTGKAFTLGPDGWDYETVVRILFDAKTELPPLAIIYLADVDEAENAGRDHIFLNLEGIAKTSVPIGGSAGFHHRQVKIPLKVAKMLAHATYDDYLEWRQRQLSAK